MTCSSSNSRTLYDAENRITKALPKMAKAATSPALKAAFEKHLAETEGQVKRLEQVFEALGEKAKTKTCKAMQGLIAEGEETMCENAEPEVLDAALIAAAQRVEHYEMAGYGTVRSYAKLLEGRRHASGSSSRRSRRKRRPTRPSRHWPRARSTSKRPDQDFDRWPREPPRQAP